MRYPWVMISDKCDGSDQGVCPVVARVSGVTVDPGGEYLSSGIKQPLKGCIEVAGGTACGDNLKEWEGVAAVGDNKYPAYVEEGECGVKAAHQSAGFDVKYCLVED